MSKKTKKKIEDRVVVTNPFAGLLYMQVCVAKGVRDKEILEQANAKNPCGTTAGWGTVIRKKTEYTPGTVKCADDSTRQHILLSC